MMYMLFLITIIIIEAYAMHVAFMANFVISSFVYIFTFNHNKYD